MDICKKVSAGERIAFDEALELENCNLYELGRAAQERMKALDSSGTVGYVINRMINYSNICSACCKFCAYHARGGIVPAFRMTDDEIFNMCADAVARGGVQIMLQGGLHPNFRLDWAESILRRIKSSFPKLWLHVFSPSEVVWFARGAKISISECVRRLKDAGADSIPGAADMLVPEIRKELCGNKCTVEEWTIVMEALKANGMYSSATMTFGMGESFAQRIQHLNVVRDIQDKLGVFKAFIAWPVAPEHTQIEHLVERASSTDFLRTLAISRIFLDNIKYVQSGWLTEGLKVAEIALHFGSNDVGGVLMDEMVVRAAGIDNRATPSNMRKVITASGFIPRQRDGLYDTIETF